MVCSCAIFLVDFQKIIVLSLIDILINIFCNFIMLTPRLEISALTTVMFVPYLSFLNTNKIQEFMNLVFSCIEC